MVLGKEKEVGVQKTGERNEGDEEGPAKPGEERGTASPLTVEGERGWPVAPLLNVGCTSLLPLIP